jgi:hypothetical protein
VKKSAKVVKTGLWSRKRVFPKRSSTVVVPQKKKTWSSKNLNDKSTTLNTRKTEKLKTEHRMDVKDGLELCNEVKIQGKHGGDVLVRKLIVLRR